MATHCAAATAGSICMRIDQFMAQPLKRRAARNTPQHYSRFAPSQQSHVHLHDLADRSSLNGHIKASTTPFDSAIPSSSRRPLGSPEYVGRCEV